MPIYARTSGGVYKAISKILTADGSEIGKVVDSTDRIIYEASRPITVTGVPPISFTKSIGKPLVSWDLLGNAQQTGTPSPQSIIMPTFCGVRTGSLINPDSKWSSRKVSDGVYRGKIQQFYSSPFYMPESLVGKTVTAKCYISGNLNGTSIRWRFASNDSSKDSSSLSSDGYITVTFTISSSSDNLRIYYGSGSTREITITKFMVNEGSTALPYEPYGYKIPFNNHGDNLANLILGKVPRVSDGTLVTFDGLTSEYVPITSMSDTFSLTFDKPESTKRFYAFFYSGDTLQNTKDLNYGTTITTYGVSSTVDRMRIRIDYGGSTVSNVMLVKGSTPKPYSPYFSETIPVYLGQTQTVRRVKKLVLTGQEQIGNYDGTYSRFSIVFSDSLILGVRKSPVISSHLIGISDGRGVADVPNNAIYSDAASGNGRWFIKTTDYTTAANFKSFLASEYAAGTPVTVWYVLATPETGIVNEPLAKIGDYADELHSTDTAVTIPTTKGNNTLTVDTELPPSSMTIVYKGRRDSGS